MYIRFNSLNSSRFDYDDSGLIDLEDYESLQEDQEPIDEWGVALCIDDTAGIGVEYNLCIDWNADGTPLDTSAFYFMTSDKDFIPDSDDWSTDTSEFMHYTIDFYDPDYREALKEVAINYLSSLIDQINGK